MICHDTNLKILLSQLENDKHTVAIILSMKIYIYYFIYFFKKGKDNTV